MADGTTKPVQQIKEGDLVLSKDETTGIISPKRVTGTSTRTVPVVETVNFADDAGKVIESLTVTGDHPFYVEGEGFLPASQLPAGIKVETKTGTLTVSSTERHETAQGFVVHNFTVEDDHSYFVGSASGGAWVHNGIVCGEFSIIDWTGYPEGMPRPTGPFRLLEGAEYDAALAAKNAANRNLHRLYSEFNGFAIHEWHPVKFGGSPTDVANKYPLRGFEHTPITTFWNNLQRSLTR